MPIICFSMDQNPTYLLKNCNFIHLRNIFFVFNLYEDQLLREYGNFRTNINNKFNTVRFSAAYLFKFVNFIANLRTKIFLQECPLIEHNSEFKVLARNFFNYKTNFLHLNFVFASLTIVCPFELNRTRSMAKLCLSKPGVSNYLAPRATLETSKVSEGKYIHFYVRIKTKSIKEIRFLSYFYEKLEIFWFFNMFSIKNSHL